MFDNEPTNVETIKPCARCWLQPTIDHAGSPPGWYVYCSTCRMEDGADENRAAAIAEWNGQMSALNEAVIVAGVIDG